MNDEVEETAAAPSPEGKPVGFIERRWRMFKAGAKKMFGYLFDIKTYVYAGVLFGGAALLGNTGTKFGTQIAEAFGVTGGASGVLMGMGRAIIIGTIINTGVGMFKESQLCNECLPEGATPPSVNQAAVKAAEKRARAAEQQYGYEASSGYTPSPLPMKPTQAQGHQPSQNRPSL